MKQNLFKNLKAAILLNLLQLLTETNQRA